MTGCSAITVPLAFLVLSHTEPPLVRRLAQRLLGSDPECHVIVDHYRAGPALDLEAHDRLHLRSSDRGGGWGGFGLVSAVLDAMGDVDRDLAPEWLVLLSGQDYPAVTAAAIRRRLETSGHDALLDLWRVVDARERDGLAAWWRARYFMRWYDLPDVPGLRSERAVGALRRVSLAQPYVFFWPLPRGAGARIGFRRRRTPFGPGFPCRAGSQWFALGRAAQASVLEQTRHRPELVDHYRRTIIPDESFFNTLVANDPALTVAGENLTFVRMEGGGKAHAAVLDESDLPAIEASGRAVVRKVQSGRSDALMDALDRR